MAIIQKAAEFDGDFNNILTNYDRFYFILTDTPGVSKIVFEIDSNTGTKFDKPIERLEITGSFAFQTGNAGGIGTFVAGGQITSVEYFDFPNSTINSLGTPRLLYSLSDVVFSAENLNQPDITLLQYFDSFENGSGNDIFGTNGNDVLTGTSLDDNISALGGNDVVHGGGGNDSIFGGKGNDSLFGDDGNDSLHGEAGADKLYGGNGNDFLYGDIGNDMLYGQNGNDYLNGGTGNDTMYGGDGNDVLEGGIGIDRLYGDGGSDTLFGGAGNDILDGGAGNDFLYGGDGKDDLVGGAGNDYLDGGSGNDYLIGGLGNDGVKMGAGADIFLFQNDGNGTSYGNDTIFDFTHGQDKIRFEDGSLNYSQLQGMMTETSQGVLIEIDNTSLLLEGLHLSDLSQADFIFG